MNKHFVLTHVQKISKIFRTLIIQTIIVLFKFILKELFNENITIIWQFGDVTYH